MCVQKTAWERCVEFHGHSCPGLAIGYRAAEVAMERLGIGFSRDEELVCVTENDACGVDAIQVLTGCSLGKGNLIYRATGKQAFSFFNRSTGDKLRIVYKKRLDKKTMDKAERERYILTAPIDDLFDLKEPNFEPPQRARLFNSIECELCGEYAAEHRMRLYDGKKVCADCYPDYSRGW